MSNSITNNPGSRKVLITTAYQDPEPITSFLALAALDRIKKYELVTDPEAADIIFFIENSHYHGDYFFSELKKNHLVRKYPNKVFMYNSHDMPWLILPGLYACMPKRYFDKSFMAASPYIEVINPYINCDFTNEPKFLFSFYGALSSIPRRKLPGIRHQRGRVLVSTVGMYGEHKPEDLQLQYAQLLSDSKFVLCPKGIGTSSIRLFETLQAGRVPVIIADDWVAPMGPDWEQFAVFIREKDVYKIPEILELEEHHWNTKSRLARKAWEDFFAPDVMFSYMIDVISCFKENYTTISRSAQIVHYMPYIRYVFRALVIRRIKKITQLTKRFFSKDLKRFAAN